MGRTGYAGTFLYLLFRHRLSALPSPTEIRPSTVGTLRRTALLFLSTRRKRLCCLRKTFYNLASANHNRCGDNLNCYNNNINSYHDNLVVTVTNEIVTPTILVCCNYIKKNVLLRQQSLFLRVAANNKRKKTQDVKNSVFRVRNPTRWVMSAPSNVTIDIRSTEQEFHVILSPFDHERSEI